MSDFDFMTQWVKWCQHTAEKLTKLTDGFPWRARDVEMAALATVMMREVEGVARRINGVWYGSPGNIGIIRGIELVMNHPDFKKIVEMLVSTADTGIYGSRFPALPDRDRVRPFVRLGMNQPLKILSSKKWNSILGRERDNINGIH